MIEDNGDQDALEKLDRSKDAFGIIYSSFGELGPRPQTWVPKTLTYDAVLEILMRSTCFISVDLTKMHDKLAVFPFPEYNMVGMSYYFAEPSTDETDSSASITILINESSQEFFNRNLSNIKGNLRSLTRQLNETGELRERILYQYLMDLEELINSYKSLEKIAEPPDKAIDPAKSAVLLSYFHAKIGPMPFFMYPELPFNDQDKLLISKELELSINEGFFTRTYPNFVALHHYFELPSKLARGKTEMCLLTFIYDKLPSQDTISHISFHFQKLIENLKSVPDVSLAFYEEGYALKDQADKINAKGTVLRQWVKDVYEVCIERKAQS